MKPLLAFFIVILMVFGTWRAIVFIRNQGDKGAVAQNETTADQTSLNQTPETQANGVQTLTEAWTYALQSPLGGKDELDGVSADSKGNVIIGGPFQYTVDFNGVPRTAKTGIDIYISKLSPTGKEIWFTSIDSGGNDFLWDLETDKNDDILISGGYGGTLTVNGKTYNASRDGSALYGKIDGETGNIVWIQTAGVIGSGTGLVDSERTAGGNEIKVDSKGNVVAILSAHGDSYQIGNRTYRPSGVMDGFIVKLSPTGEFLWEYQFLGNGRKQGRAIAVNGKDEIAFGHELNGGIDTKEGIGFSGTNNKVEIGTAGLLTPDGKLKWMVPVTSEGLASVRGAGGDIAGNVYFSGVITEASKIGTTPAKGYKNGSTFLAKYTSAGVQEWVRVMGNDETDYGGELITFDNSIAITSSNKGDNYNLYDETGTLLQEDIHTVSSRETRATLTVFNSEGDITARHSPTYTDVSKGGVLGYAGKNCIVFQNIFYGTIKYANGDSYTAKNSTNTSKPDKDLALAKVCLP